MLGAIAMVLAMFALVGAAGLGGGLRLQSLNAALVEHSIEELQAVARVRAHLASVRLLEKQMVIDYEDGVAVLKHREAWTREIAATQEALKAMLGGEADEDNTLAQHAIDELAAYAKASDPVLTQIQNGGYDNARIVDTMLARAKQHVAAVEADVEKINGIVDAESKATQEAFASTMFTVLLVFCGALALVVVLVVPLTLLNSHSITRPISYARTVAQAIAAGDLSRPIRVEGRDEASDLLARAGPDAAVAAAGGGRRAAVVAEHRGRQPRGGVGQHRPVHTHRADRVEPAADRQLDGAADRHRGPERRRGAPGQPARHLGRGRGAARRRRGGAGGQHDGRDQRTAAAASATSSAPSTASRSRPTSWR